MTSISTSQPNVLQAARDAAMSSREYSSARTRKDLVDSFKEAFKGLEPYSWQLDIAEALILGLDCIAIAGTGSGKTMPFVMPLLVDRTKKKMVIVISPLNDLEDRVSLFRCH
jgi:superfamily II DNA/RNA helicase